MHLQGGWVGWVRHSNGMQTGCELLSPPRACETARRHPHVDTVPRPTGARGGASPGGVELASCDKGVKDCQLKKWV
jgi:hypothetical protein